MLEVTGGDGRTQRDCARCHPAVRAPWWGRSLFCSVRFTANTGLNAWAVQGARGGLRQSRRPGAGSHRRCGHQPAPSAGARAWPWDAAGRPGPPSPTQTWGPRRGLQCPPAAGTARVTTDARGWPTALPYPAWASAPSPSALLPLRRGSLPGPHTGAQSPLLAPGLARRGPLRGLTGVPSARTEGRTPSLHPISSFGKWGDRASSGLWGERP